jgi:hypothetical protein
MHGRCTVHENVLKLYYRIIKSSQSTSATNIIR